MKQAETQPVGNQDAVKEIPKDEEMEIMENLSFVEQLVLKWNSLGIARKISLALISILAIGMAVFHIYTSLYGTLPAWQHRAVHLCLGLVLMFILYPFNKEKGFKWWDLLPVLLSFAILVYVIVDYPGQELRIGDPNRNDIILGTVLIALVLESARRTNGWPMALLGLLFIVYIFTGPYFPGLFGHQGYRYVKMIDQMFNGTVGIFGSPIYVSSTILILFIIWGSFLLKSGAGQFFTDLAMGAAGHKRGGPALAAVISSALVGSITGNGAANVAITGSFTIPLMKKVGYRPAFAGAVESVASQGGQIMPPIMGAAAFIMAEYVGVPYIKIAAFALIPAMLYFIICGVIVYLQAKKMGLSGVPKEELPDLWQVFKQGFYFFLPILFIIYMLAIGNSPMKAGAYAIFLTAGLSYIRRATWLKPLDLLACLEKGTRSTLSVISACATAGIIVGSVSLTGLGIRFSRLAVDVAGDSMMLMLFMIMVAAIILGMGMPTVSAYIILAVLGAPALVKIGVDPIAAHMFVLYFGIISGLTPPVAITAYTAAGIAGSNPTKTALLATKIGIGGFLLPFMFVYNPTLLLQGGDVALIIQSVITSLIGCIAFAMFMQGYCFVETNWFERISLLILSLLLIDPGGLTDLIGLGLLLFVVFSQLRKVRQGVRTGNKEISLT